MSRRDIIANIEKFKKRKAEHEDKIRKNPNDREVPHWRTEIRNFEREISKLERDLSVAMSKSFCPNCKREVSLNGSKCSICRLVIDA